MKTKKPYYRVTAMSQGDNTGLDDMAGTVLCPKVYDQGQMDHARPRPGLKPLWLEWNYELPIDNFFLTALS